MQLGPYIPSCGARAADGVARGAIIGVAWGVCMGEVTTALHFQSLYSTFA